MAAFRLARDHGADGIELDVQETVDGELVVIHDFAVDRTTDGSGQVVDLTAAAVARLDAGGWFSDSFAGEPVPRLSEVLALDALELEVELKAFSRDFMARTVKAVEEAAALDRTEFTSWNTPMLMALRQDFPGARIGIFSPRRGAWMIDSVFERTILGLAEYVPAAVVHVHAADVTASIVGELHDRGHLVLANDAKSADEIRRAIDCGADRLTTDDPAKAVGVRSETRR